MAKHKIAEAAGSASGSFPGTGEEGRARAARIERAMIAATEQAMKDGITDPAIILKIKLKAREDAKQA